MFSILLREWNILFNNIENYFTDNPEIIITPFNYASTMGKLDGIDDYVMEIESDKKGIGMIRTVYITAIREKIKLYLPFKTGKYVLYGFEGGNRFKDNLDYLTIIDSLWRNVFKQTYKTLKDNVSVYEGFNHDYRSSEFSKVETNLTSLLANDLKHLLDIEVGVTCFCKEQNYIYVYYKVGDCFFSVLFQPDKEVWSTAVVFSKPLNEESDLVCFKRC